MDVTVLRSQRKTLAVHFLSDGGLQVRAPLFCSDEMIRAFLEKNEKRILERQREIMLLPKPQRITRETAVEMRRKAKETILPRVEYWSKYTGFSHNGARITSARGRFGSCSGKNTLCFSLFLVLASQEEIDYVILHELCHTREHNHSPRFYALVERFMPNWKERERKLKQMVIPEIEG